MNLESLITPEDHEELKDTRWLQIPEQGEQIGEGAYSKVFLYKLEDGSVLAGKIPNISLFNKTAEEIEKIKKHFNDALREVKLLQQLDHERIIKFFGFYLDPHQLIIFMEEMKGSLKEEIREHGLPEKEAIKYLTQATEGLAYLHNRRPRAIIHRDIKCENLLLTAEKNVKLSDLGLSVDLALSSGSISNPSAAPTSFTGTLFFMAPEVIGKMNQPEAYGRKSDIWSLACTIVQMITGKPPHTDLRFVDFVKRFSVSGKEPLLPYTGHTLLPSASDPMKLLLDSMLLIDVSARLDAQQVLDMVRRLWPWTIDQDNSLGRSIADDRNECILDPSLLGRNMRQALLITTQREDHSSAKPVAFSDGNFGNMDQTTMSPITEGEDRSSENSSVLSDCNNENIGQIATLLITIQREDLSAENPFVFSDDNYGNMDQTTMSPVTEGEDRSSGNPFVPSDLSYGIMSQTSVRSLVTEREDRRLSYPYPNRISQYFHNIRQSLLAREEEDCSSANSCISSDLPYANIRQTEDNYSSSDSDDGGHRNDRFSWSTILSGIPWFIIVIIITQIVVFAVYGMTAESKLNWWRDCAGCNVNGHDGPLVFVARLRHQLWRFISYMFVHNGLFNNFWFVLCCQLIFGVPLEMLHKAWRIGLIYLYAVIFSAMLQYVIDPSMNFVGATAVAYALITAHIPSVLLNWSEKPLWFRWVRLLECALFVVTDLVFSAFQIYDDKCNITRRTYALNIGGYATGLLMGFMLLRERNELTNSSSLALIGAKMLSICLILSAAVMTITVKPDSEPFWNITCSSNQTWALVGGLGSVVQYIE